jgi:hypothetical protein
MYVGRPIAVAAIVPRRHCQRIASTWRNPVQPDRRWTSVVAFFAAALIVTACHALDSTPADHIATYRALEDAIMKRVDGVEDSAAVKAILRDVGAHRNIVATLPFSSPEATALALHDLHLFARTAADNVKTARVSSDEVRKSIRQAADANLTLRLSAKSQDRVGVTFGVGVSVIIWDRVDAEGFRILSEPAGSGSTQNVMVRASKSRTFPAVMTGIAARFRDRWTPPSGWVRYPTNVADWFVPTAVFATAQLGFTEVSGATGGVSLGLGWQIIGDVHMLVGYSATRLGSLREDLREKWDATSDGRLVLPAGETEESIRSSEVANGIVVMFATPVALKKFFGSD